MKDSKIAINKNKKRKLKEALTVNGTEYKGVHKFACLNEVPVYEVFTYHAFNQIIGFAKFINQSYGKVFYRGECNLHNSLIPSLLRGNCTVEKKRASLNKIVEKIRKDHLLNNELKLDNSYTSQLRIESLLQHYGIPTSFIDVVDNHWIALWMGLNKSIEIKSLAKYCHYEERRIPRIIIEEDKENLDKLLYQYVLLIAVPSNKSKKNKGIEICDDYEIVDLRKALPSTFLRPHAQHGIVIKKKVHTQSGEKILPASYDLADSVIGILKIRIDNAKEWLGNGMFLTQNNLFPAPAYDNGYDILLSREDIFCNTEFSIVRYM